MSKPEEFKFDSRVRDRFLRGRVLSQAELQKHLEELPDLECEYEVMSDTPQPAVAPPRSEVNEEPLVFDGIRISLPTYHAEWSLNVGAGTWTP